MLNDNIFQLDTSFSQQLDVCSYAGEIVLTRGELLKLGRHLREFVMNGSLSRVKHVLLVFAVNIAFFYYDEDGFWHHFCSVCGIEPANVDTSSIGRIIERVLSDKKMLSKRREGPFRYVGAVLEQIGMTKRYIPVFSTIVEEMERSEYNQNLLTDYEGAYAQYINSLNCSRYLKNYLLDKSGWEFLIDVLRVLEYLKADLIDGADLQGISGFHPGFWNEFLKHYGYSTNYFEPPRLMFDHEQMQVYLLLPNARYAVEHLQTDERVEQQDGTIRINLTQIEDYRMEYCGYHTDEIGRTRKWRIDGWDPIRSKRAVFHPGSGYTDSRRTMPSGRLFFISSDSDVGDIYRVVDDLGNLRIGDKLLHVFEVIRSTRQDCTGRTVLIRWSTEPDLTINSGYEYDIFYDSLPGLEVENADLFADGSHILVFDNGKQRRRIHDYRTLTEISRQLRVSPCYSGEIRVVRLGREGSLSPDAAGRVLRFCVIPRSEIHFPEQIYSEEEKISFTCTSPYVCFSNCYKVTGSGGLYEVPPSVDVIYGIVNSSHQQIHFRYPVKRVGLVFDGEPEIRYLDPTAENDNRNITLIAPGGSVLSLGLISRGKLYILIKKIVFDNSGTFTFEVQSLLKALQRNGIYAGEFAVVTDERVVPTGKGIISYLMLKRDLSVVNELYEDMALISRIDSLMSNRIEQLYSIYHGHEPMNISGSVNNDPVFSTLLGAYRIIDEGQRLSWTTDQEKTTDCTGAELSALAWVVHAREAIKECNLDQVRSLLDRHGRLEWEPPLERWRVKIEKIYNELLFASKEENLISEWKAVVLGHEPSTRSMVYAARNGRSLTVAWRQYLHHNYHNAVNLLRYAENAENSLVTVLGRILLCIIYLRNLRISSILNLTAAHMGCGKLWSVLGFYRNLGLLLSGREMDRAEPVPEEIADALPLLPEDRDLITGISRMLNAGFMGNRHKASDHNSDWAEALIICFLAKRNGGDYRQYLDRLRLLAPIIPDSPEKKMLLDKLLDR